MRREVAKRRRRPAPVICVACRCELHPNDIGAPTHQYDAVDGKVYECDFRRQRAVGP